ncbi:hypothetical protein BDV93DRAFT_605788 [Ceratobasidium sp. AG-I]|nr:hypothetical protein BDV93DRAFT_605788 [Ceratobasidium sp. AG-I]
MVIIDPQDKSPSGPRPVPQTPLGPPPYVPLSAQSLPSPPPRSPGVRPPASPYSAPASNFLTIKRERADIGGSWHINTSLPAPATPNLGRTFSTGSDRDSDVDAASEAGTHTGTDFSDPLSNTGQGSVSSAATSLSLNGSAVRPNLKLLSPRGKIDATIRVSGGPRAWIEAISRDEDVTIIFPSNPNGAPRAPIRLFVRSTLGNVQVTLPKGFKGTLRVPSETILPPSLRSLSVVLSPSEPPIDRPPIADEGSTKPKLLGSLPPLPPRGATPLPPSPPSVAAPTPVVAEGQTPQLPAIIPPTAPSSPPAPSSIPAPPTSEGGSQSEVQSTSPAATSTSPIEMRAAERSTTGGSVQTTQAETPRILDEMPVETPAQEIPPPLVQATSSTPTPSSPPPSIATPATPPVTSVSTPPASPPTASATTGATLSVPKTSTSIPTPIPGHNRTFSASSSHLPLSPAPAHDTSESSTVYFIGDLLHSSYDTNAPDRWDGDEFILDSEHARVRVWGYGEKAEVSLMENAAGKVRDAVDWGKWKNVASGGLGMGAGAGGSGGKGGTMSGVMQLNMPKMSVSGMAKRFKFGK